MRVEIGDVVRTKKGSRFKECSDNLVVVEIGKKWKDYDAVICKKENGDKRLFLLKNLYKVSYKGRL